MNKSCSRQHYRWNSGVRGELACNGVVCLREPGPYIFVLFELGAQPLSDVQILWDYLSVNLDRRRRARHGRTRGVMAVQRWARASRDSRRLHTLGHTLFTPGDRYCYIQAYGSAEAGNLNLSERVCGARWTEPASLRELRRSVQYSVCGCACARDRVRVCVSVCIIYYIHMHCTVLCMHECTCIYIRVHSVHTCRFIVCVYIHVQLGRSSVQSLKAGKRGIRAADYKIVQGSSLVSVSVCVCVCVCVFVCVCVCM